MKIKGLRNFPKRLFIISILLCLGLVFFYHKTQYKKLSKKQVELEKNYKKILEHLKKSQKEANNLPLVRMRIDSLTKVWEKVQASLPSEGNLDFWLQAAAKAGSRAGIEFEKFEPNKIRPHNLYDEYPIEIEVSGGYHEVATFLSFLLNLPRIGHIEEVNIEGDKKPVFPTETVKAKFTLSTYAYNPQARPPEAHKKKYKRKRSKKKSRTKTNRKT